MLHIGMRGVLAPMDIELLFEKCINCLIDIKRRCPRL
jgi:hypothetical protein